MRAVRWTDEEKNFLRENYRKIPTPEIAAQLGTTPKQVNNAAKRYKITKSRIWTEEQIENVRRLYPTTPAAAIAKLIGKSVSGVYNAAFKLGMRKDPEVILAQNRQLGRNLSEAGLSYQFPKGHVPVNKGLRRPGWHCGRMKETQFKKGQFSANRREIGEERTVDGYVYVKVADGLKNRNWRQKHWVVWEQHNGPVPEGHAIAFKDGDKRNFAIENLELVSRRQLMKRNSVHNYPEPVKEAIFSLTGFKRRLNNYAKEQDSGPSKHAVRDDGKATG